jgi:phosphomannomutase
MKKILLLFDVDGTLTLPRIKISDDMIEMLHKIYDDDFIDMGFVGGSDFNKQIEQIGKENMDLFTWKFSENGLTTYFQNTLIHEKKIIDFLGENNYKRLVNVCLRVISETNIPIKRGNFIELRNGMINISPIGRSCTQEERDYFDLYDKKNKVRENMINIISEELLDLNLQYSIGGQISIDIFPKGWDKTYCLQFVENKYEEIYFYGDKTDIGGNDYELFNDNRVNGFHVNKYTDTIKLLKKFL